MADDRFFHQGQQHGSSEETTGDSGTAGRAGGSSVRRGMTSRRLAAVATGTTIALGAGGIAYAATTTDPTAPTDSAASPTEAPTDAVPAPSGTPGDELAPDGRHEGPGWSHGGPGPAGMPFGFGMALHGEQVVQAEDGTYLTIATQRGVIEELSAGEVTVTSDDGFSRSYTLTDVPAELDSEGTDPELLPDPVDADLAVGDEVMVVAQLDGTTATVLHLRAVDDLPGLGGHLEGGHHGPWGGEQDEAPEGTPS